MNVTLDFPDEFAYLLKDNEFLETCFRDTKSRFKKFVKATIVDNHDGNVKEILDSVLNALESSSVKAEHSLNVLDKNVNDLSKQIGDLSKKADSIMEGASKALDFVNVFMNAANLCATVAGIMIISNKMDEISKELAEISRDVKSISKHQELLQREKVKGLLNEYADIRNSESLGRELNSDIYYNLVNNMYLTIDTLLECFNNDVGNRETYLNCISLLLPLYAVSLCKFDKAHYFEYGKVHSNRETYVKLIDQFSTYEFFAALQEFSYLKDNSISHREAFNAAYAYIAKIDEQRVAIADNLAIISKFDSLEKFNDFEIKLNKGFTDKIIESCPEDLPAFVMEDIQKVVNGYAAA